jgi:two-component system copper resistance phosphate regulon response regulator CusR
LFGVFQRRGRGKHSFPSAFSFSSASGKKPKNLLIFPQATMRILIIEDEQRVWQFLKKGLEAESISVDVATDGEKGLAMARGESYDAVILDVMLPKMGGMEVLRSIRQSGNNTPVLILSARGGTDDRVEGLNLGADDYLPKPFSFTEVLARVRAIVRRTSADLHASTLTVGTLRVDLLTRKVEREEKELTLTAKEFELLEYLMRNKGRVLSRVILMERIWDMNFDSETNVVDVLINRLRRKIDDDFPSKLIHTVRGAGYVLKETVHEADEPD